MQKITENVLMESRKNCYDYLYKNNNSNLRERYAFYFLEVEFGIVLVEANINGTFVVKAKVGLAEAYDFISKT